MVSNKKISKKELEAIANENKSCKYILSEIKPLRTIDDIFIVVDNEYKTISSNESLINIFKAIAEKEISGSDKIKLYNKIKKYILQNPKLGLHTKVNRDKDNLSSLANHLVNKKEIAKPIVWLEEEVKHLEQSNYTIEKGLPIKKIEWNGSLNTLVDVFYQLKGMSGKNNKPLLNASANTIADLLLSNFTGFESRQSILDMLNSSKEIKRPQTGKNKIYIERLENTKNV